MTGRTTLHFTNAWHATSGGISTFYRALLSYANGAGWRMRMVVPGERSSYERVGKYCGIHYVAGPRAPYSPEYRILYPASYLLPRAPVQQILRDEQPDLVEVSDKYSLLYLAGLLRVGAVSGVRRPLVIGLSCERMDENVSAYTGRTGFARWFSEWYMRAIYFRQFDHHIAVSDHTAGELAAAAQGHKIWRGIWVRGMGVDTGRFTPARRSLEKRVKYLNRTKASDDAAIVLYAGRIAPEKNWRLIVDSLELLGTRKVHLIVAGDGPDRENFLQDARKRVPVPFTYLGYLKERDELADLYANCDIFVHPNPREPFGIAPLEAMAAGMALVAPDSGGVTTYANEGNAWVVPANGARFAAAINEILDNAGERERRRVAAHITAQHFSWSVACERFAEIYAELLARKQDISRVFDERTAPWGGDRTLPNAWIKKTASGNPAA